MDPPQRSRTRTLQNSLADLHTRLTRTQRVDEPAARALREVLSDIERLLQQSPAAPAADTGADTGASAQAGAVPAPPESAERRHRLEGLEVQLEARHPALAATLRELIELLGQAGL